MSNPRRKRISIRHGVHASVFAALGDPRRLRLLGKLCGGPARSISQLTVGTNLTRQAVTKHLRVLERAGVLRCIRKGRERLFEFKPEPIAEVRKYLDLVSAHWDDALARLQSFVER